MGLTELKRVLTVVDVFTRERLAVHADRSLTGRKVAAILDTVAHTRKLPKEITVDNGTEFFSKAMDAWRTDTASSLTSSGPGARARMASSKASTEKLRDECLNAELFSDLLDARTKLEAWRTDYNENRPHSSIGNLTPMEFANQVRTYEGQNRARSSS